MQKYNFSEIKIKIKNAVFDNKILSIQLTKRPSKNIVNVFEKNVSLYHEGNFSKIKYWFSNIQDKHMKNKQEHVFAWILFLAEVTGWGVFNLWSRQITFYYNEILVT